MTKNFFGAGVLMIFALGACSSSSTSDGVASTDDAKTAYLALDASIDTAIALGFQGFNAATSANIAPQTASGKASGTLTVGGQVDQGASSNKTMNLTETMAGYSDDGTITFATRDTALPTLSMKLSKIPDGTMTGTLDGVFVMTGALAGDVKLTVTLTADLEASPADAGGAGVQRKAGTTHITGTATSGTSTYAIDVTK
jgi:hypothetical protein